jgi:hypothetical protein
LETSIDPNQPEEILLQLLFLHYQLCGRGTGIDQQAVDIIRALDGRGIFELDGTVVEDFCRLPGGYQHPVSHLNLTCPYQKPPPSILLQLSTVQFLEQIPIVDNPYPPGKT